MMSTLFLRRFLSLVVLVVFFAVPLSAAEPPKITVAPQWHPGTMLDSIDSLPVGTLNGADDFRYVDVDIYVTTTVQFWSVQLTCTASPASLTSYDDANLDGDPNNANAPVIWGPVWGMYGTDFTHVVDAYNTTTGARTITATALGNRYPMGGANGTREVLLIATLRYRAKDIAANANATFMCTSTFLNRNGTPVLVATYTPPPPLPVITNYVASGTVLYQGRTAHAGINVNCDYNNDNNHSGTGPNDFSILTTATGAWTATTRAQGYFACDFYGNTINPAPGYQPDRYLAARTSFDLRGLSYTMLPITLLGGNFPTDSNNTIDESINFNDVVNNITIPGVWNKAVATGDVNGDGKTNQVDLTIAASNVDTSEATDSSHILFDIPRDYDYWQHSRVWLGGVNASTTTSMLATPSGEVRDLWATMSPDGKRLAFIRQIVKHAANIPEFGVYTAPITNGVAGTPVLISPVNVTALAPSWSPDGTRIAFVCSWYDDGSTNSPERATGYLVDEGHLCIVDANGRNFRNLGTVIVPNVVEPNKTHIYPPAWLSNNEILHGGAWGNGLCENTLCYVNLQTNEFRLFDVDVMTGGTGTLLIADMPIVRGNILFYRFNDLPANSRKIRWATIIPLTGPGTYPGIATFKARDAVPAPTSPYHMVVDFNDVTYGYQPLTDAASYYTVSTSGMNVIYYDQDTASQIWQARLKMYVGGIPEWYHAGAPVIHDFIANTINGAHTPYDPNNADPGDLMYAYRNTMEWLP
jgi:hypothetical protein